MEMSIVARAVSRAREASFYKRLLFSYIAGLLIVLLIVSMTCVGLVDTISDFSNKAAVNATAQFQSTVESMVDSVQRIPTELSLSPAVVSLAATQSPEFDARQRYSVIDLSRQLKSYDLSNPYISGIFLYFPIQDYLVSDQGVYTLSLWQRINGQREGLESLLAGKQSICWDSLDSGEKTIMCAKLPTESDLTDRALAQDLMQRSQQREKDVVTLQKDYIGYMTPSEAYSFYYMYFSPKNDFFGTLRSSKRVVVFSFLLVLTVGVVLSIVSARRASRPIVRIANLMETGSGDETTLEAIEQSVISLVETKKEACRDTERYRTSQQEAILLKLLHQEIPNEAALNSQLAQTGVTIPGDRFLAVTATSMADFPLTAVAQQFCAEFRAVTSSAIDLYFFQGAGEIKMIAAGPSHALHVPTVKQALQQAVQRLEESRHVRLPERQRKQPDFRHLVQ